MATRNELEQQAMAYIQKGQLDKALSTYTNILRSDPRDRRIRQKLGELYIKLGRLKDGAKQLREAADQTVKEGQPRAAVAIYKQLITLDPHDADLVVLLGDCYHRCGLAPEADRQFEAAMNLFASKHEHAKAVQSARRLLEIRPQDLALRFRIAELLQAGEKNAEAVVAWRELAEIFQRRGEQGEVARVLEALLSLSPDDHNARIQAADARLGLGDPQKAMELILPTTHVLPDDTRVKDILARGYLATGRPADARPLFLDLAEAYLANGDIEARTSALKRALESGADYPALRESLARSTQALEQLKRRLSEAAVLSPMDDDEVQVCTRAEVLGDYGFPTRAEATLRDGLSRKPLSLAILARLAENLLDQKRRKEGLAILVEAALESHGQARAVLLERMAALGAEIPAELRAPVPVDTHPADDGDLVDSELIDDEAVADLIDDEEELIDDEVTANTAPPGAEQGTVEEDEEEDEDEEEEDDEVFEFDPPDADPVSAALAEGEALVRAGELDRALATLQRAYQDAPSNEQLLMRIVELRRAVRKPTASPPVPAPLETVSAPPPPEPVFQPSDLLEDEAEPPAVPPDLTLGLGEGGADSVWDDLLGASTPPTPVPEAPARRPEPMFRLPPVQQVPASAAMAEIRALLAVGQFQEVLGRLADHTGLEARVLEARAHRGLGQDTQARNVLRDALEDAEEGDGAYVPALFELAEVHARLGRYRPAMRLVEELKELSPTWSPQVVDDLAAGLKLMIGRETGRGGGQAG